MDYFRISSFLLFFFFCISFHLFSEKIILNKMDLALNHTRDNTKVIRDLAFFQKKLVVATWGQGVFILDSNYRVLKLLTTKEGLNSNRINVIFPDKTGLWLGGFKGLNFFNYQQGKVDIKLSHLVFSPIHGLEMKDNYLYIGTVDKGLFSYDVLKKKLKHYSRKDGLKDSWINCLAYFSRKLWIGTNFGIFLMNLTKEKSSIKKLIAGPYTQPVTSFFIDSKENRLIVATGKGYIYIFNDKFRVIKMFYQKEILISGVVVKDSFLYLATRHGIWILKETEKGISLLKKLKGNEWFKSIKLINSNIMAGTYLGEVYKIKNIDNLKLIFSFKKKN